MKWECTEGWRHESVWLCAMMGLITTFTGHSTAHFRQAVSAIVDREHFRDRKRARCMTEVQQRQITHQPESKRNHHFTVWVILKGIKSEISLFTCFVNTRGLINSWFRLNKSSECSYKSSWLTFLRTLRATGFSKWTSMEPTAALQEAPDPFLDHLGWRGRRWDC